MKNIEPHLDKDSSSKNEEDIQAHEKLQLTLEGIIGNIVISFNESFSSISCNGQEYIGAIGNAQADICDIHSATDIAATKTIKSIENMAGSIDKISSEIQSVAFGGALQMEVESTKHERNRDPLTRSNYTDGENSTTLITNENFGSIMVSD